MAGFSLLLPAGRNCLLLFGDGMPISADYTVTISANALLLY